MQPNAVAGLRRLVLAVAAAVLLAGCSGGAMPGATTQSHEIHRLYMVVFVVGTVVFVLVELAIVFAALRYRRRDDSLPPQFHGNNKLELTWTAIPLAMVIVLFILSWRGIDQVDASPRTPGMTVRVQGFQWQWNFTYADERVPATAAGPAQDLAVEGSIARPPQLVLPVGVDIHFELYSNDVIHSFFVPGFLFKRDVVPGRVNTFDVTVDRPGLYPGQCAEFCGLAHNAMHFTVRAVSPAEFRAWVAQAKKQAASGCPTDATPGQIAAKNIAYDKQCLSEPAGKASRLTFHNEEAVPHNVAVFKGTSDSGPNVFRGQIVVNTTVVYTLPALSPGTYYFHCDVHPQAMHGKLVVH